MQQRPKTPVAQSDVRPYLFIIVNLHFYYHMPRGRYGRSYFATFTQKTQHETTDVPPVGEEKQRLGHIHYIHTQLALRDFLCAE